MITLTVTTHPKLNGHKAVDLEHRRMFGAEQYESIKLVLTRAEAIDLMDDLRSQIRYDKAQ